LTVSFERKRMMLEESDVTCGLVGCYAETYAYADGPLDVRWKGHSLPYRVFDKDQRVTHAAITENKHIYAAASVNEVEGHRSSTSSKMTVQGSRFQRNLLGATP
jgi:hypothetical protein